MLHTGVHIPAAAAAGRLTFTLWCMTRSVAQLAGAGPSQLVDVTAEMKGSIEWLMQKTARPQHHGNGRDSHGQAFRKFRVSRVQRIENKQM